MKRNSTGVRAFACLMIAGSLAWHAGAAPSTQPSATTRQFNDCQGASWCPQMVQLPAGSYLIGSPKTEVGRFDDEDQKRVNIGAFAVSRYPITRGQWAAFMKARGQPLPDGPCAYAPGDHPNWKNPGYPQVTIIPSSA